MVVTDGCENPTCDIHGNTSSPATQVESVFAVPASASQRIVTAIDQAYDVRDMALAGDARIYEIRDKVTGEYVATMSLTSDLLV